MRIVAGLGGKESSRIARQLLVTTRWPRGTVVRIADGNESGASVLLDAARRLEADLILVGSHEAGDAGASLTPLEVDLLEHMPCPVLLVKVPRVTRILLAIDGTSDPDALVSSFSRWGAFRDVPVDVVSVVPVTATVSDFVTPWAPSSLIVPQREQDLERHRAAAHVTARQLAALGWEATPTIRVGEPARELVAAAEEIGSDLVVIAARGRSGRQRSHLGSVTLDLLRRARGSVLVIGGGLVEEGSEPEAVAAGVARWST